MRSFRISVNFENVEFMLFYLCLIKVSVHFNFNAKVQQPAVFCGLLKPLVGWLRALQIGAKPIRITYVLGRFYAPMRYGPTRRGQQLLRRYSPKNPTARCQVRQPFARPRKAG